MSNEFRNIWVIANALKQPVHDSLLYTAEYPHTISFCCRKQMQIDSFMELPKEKRPPKSIWNEPDKLEDWFDRVFDREKQTEFKLNIDDIEG